MANYKGEIYSDDFIKIIHGDSLHIMPGIPADAIITDPVWPGNKIPEFQGIDPYKLFQEFSEKIPTSVKRLAVQLGCDSNPRFLSPVQIPFSRVAWLELVRPHYKGRLMYGSDVAYLYGTPPKSEKGKRVIPGRMIDADNKGRQSGHPCPRKMGHVKWLVNWWTEESDLVLDPFCGSGTTLLAAKSLGRRAVGIDTNLDYCNMAIERLKGANLPIPALGE